MSLVDGLMASKLFFWLFAPTQVNQFEFTYRKEIDGLRAVAVIPVVLFHAGFTFFGGGYVGVDVFFVISGYLITSLIIRDLSSGTFSIRSFYERRARRILPALYFLLAACIAVAYFILLPRDMADFSGSLAAVSLFSSNIFFWRASGYFDTASELKPLLHTWSLAVEEQFYVLFPVMLFLVWRFRRQWIIPLLWVTVMLSILTAEWAAYSKPAAAFYLLPTRAWELALGSLVAMYSLEGALLRSSEFTNQVLSLLGAALILGSVFFYSGETPYPSFFTLVPALGTALILACAHSGTLVARLLRTRVLVGLGLISYSVYLWHHPLFAFSRHLGTHVPSTKLSAYLVMISFVLGFLSWRYVERPFRRPGTVGRNALIYISGFGLIWFFLVGVAGVITEGFLSLRLNEGQIATLSTISTSPMRERCHTGGREYLKAENACSYFTENASWAVFGNSHGVELAYALADGLRPFGEGVRHFTFSDCPPVLSFDYPWTPGCSAWTREVVDYIVRDEHITTIVISYRTQWSSVRKDGHPDRNDHWGAYVETVRRFTAAGKNVIVVLQAPELAQSVEYYIVHRQRDGFNVQGTTRSQWEKDTEFVYSSLRELPSKAMVIDPADIFCGAEDCAAVKDGKALYFDNHHMSLAGADLVAKVIVERAGRFLNVSGN